MFRQSVFFLLTVVLTSINAQNIKLERIIPESGSPLNQLFFDYYLVAIDFNELEKSVSSAGNRHLLKIRHPEFEWDLELFENDICSPDYLLQVASDSGIEKFRRKPAIHSLIGYVGSDRGGEARITIAHHYISGMLTWRGVSYFIEPANGIDPKLPEAYFVIYNAENVFRNNKILCGYDLFVKNKKLILDQSKNQEINGRSHCLEVEIAIGNDFPVFQKRGNVTNVENWNFTILLLLQANYDNEFQHGLEFILSANFIATSAASDPWNGINDITSHLNKHVMWANGGGYGGASYDVATAWTTKYTGTVGLAVGGTVCTSLAYNVCSDYGGSNNCLRQLQAHELGHNFDADHDGNGAPYIMAPAVNCLSAWSAASIAAINNHVNSRGCLTPCSGGTPPTPDFIASPTEGCVPFVVNFTDLSTDNPVIWQWTFPGGSPASSVLKNPTVTYNSNGVFSVSLKVTNSYGSNTKIISNLILANQKPIAGFTKGISGKQLFITNTSKYGDSYIWDFGDGGGSIEPNPSHNYLEDGEYVVYLQVTNDCGIDEMTMKLIIVTPPSAEFKADTTRGCSSFLVKYKNLSTKNVTMWKWSFPGGNPSTSTAFEPEVVYEFPGVFNVMLLASNSKYSNAIEKQKYIIADTIPLSAFTYMVQMDTAYFQNHSKYQDSLKWIFGDGSQTNESNPFHIYNPGTYLASLICYSKCGVDTSEQIIRIGTELTAGFIWNPDSGCVPLAIQFINTSLKATNYLWSFPGGTPSSSTDANPQVIYAKAGNYDVDLIASDTVASKTATKHSIVKAFDVPAAEFNLSISGRTVYFTDQTINGKTYSWDFGDSTLSNEKSPTHVYSLEGEYFVQLICSNDCGSDTFQKKIGVYLIPKVDFIADTLIICGSGLINFYSKASIDVNSWFWELEGGNPDHSISRNPQIYYNKKGKYSVKLTVQNSNGSNSLLKPGWIEVRSSVFCPDTINPNYQLIEAPHLIFKNSDISDFYIYPNPSNGKVKLVAESDADFVELRIINLYGKELYCELIRFSDGVFKKELDLNNFDNGSYFVNIKSLKHSITKNMIISNK